MHIFRYVVAHSSIFCNGKKKKIIKITEKTKNGKIFK